MGRAAAETGPHSRIPARQAYLGVGTPARDLRHGAERDLKVQEVAEEPTGVGAVQAQRMAPGTGLG